MCRPLQCCSYLLNVDFKQPKVAMATELAEERNRSVTQCH